MIMKHVTLLLLGVLLCSNSVTAQQRFVSANTKSEKSQVVKYVGAKREKSQVGTKRYSVARSENVILKPQTEIIYGYMDGEWNQSMTANYKYDLKGNVMEEISDDGEMKSKTISVYNNNNKPLSRISTFSEDGGEEWVNNEKKEYEYDSVVSDFITKNTSFSWGDKTWNVNFSNQFDVIRNGKGYVTKMSILSLYQEKYDEIEYTETIYDNGELPAQTWKHYVMNENLEMNEAVKYDKIKWERTDGQILNHDEGEFLVGNNLIKAADVYDYGEKTATLKVTYTNNNRNFESVMSSVDGPGKITHTMTYTDEYGSYKEKVVEEFDKDQDGVMEMYARYALITCDDHKNIISEEFFEELEGEGELTDGTKVAYTYGDNGEILETITSIFNYEIGEYEPVEKIVADDFIEIQGTGVNAYTQETLKCSVEDDQLIFSMNGARHYTVYNVSGTQMMNNNMTNASESVSLSGFPNGLYLLVVEGDKGMIKTKFMKR